MAAPDPVAGGKARCSKCGAALEVDAATTRSPLGLVARRARELRGAEKRMDAAMRGASDRGASARDIARAAGLAHSTVARFLSRDHGGLYTRRRPTGTQRRAWVEPALEGLERDVVEQVS
jgi:hypothetical protein